MTVNAPPNESQVAYHRRRASELNTVRAPWETVWRPLADFIEPSRYRPSSRSEGPARRDAIIDSTATFARGTLASGMHSGITSPARPWFRLSTFDPELRDFEPVRLYLSEVERIMREVFQGSNIYTAFHTGYGDLGQFGQSCGLLVEDEQNSIRMQQLVHGRFWIARDESGRATTLYRVFTWSVERIVRRFKNAALDASPTIRNAWDRGRYGDKFDVWHAVEPRMERDPSKIDKRNKPFLSNYWLDGGGPREGDALLEESGFDENPIIAPPWELSADETYAVSPGQIVLGDVRMLQREQERKMEGIDKKVRPPMTGPTSMRNNPASLLPGSITYVDDPTGKGYRPAIEANIDLSHLMQDIRETRERIDRGFYADLFLMLANMEGIQPRNSFEIAERKEEKLLALGPVLENVYGGQLGPTIDRAYAILNRRGMLPPPPIEIQRQQLKVEYISILAQAQKAVATGSIERGLAFVGNLAEAKPDVLDKIDADEAVDIYFDYLGVPPSIIVSDDKVTAAREGRAQKQAMAENAAIAAEIAPAAKAGAEAAGLLSQAADRPGSGALLSRLGLA